MEDKPIIKQTLLCFVYSYLAHTHLLLDAGVVKLLTFRALHYIINRTLPLKPKKVLFLLKIFLFFIRNYKFKRIWLNMFHSPLIWTPIDTPNAGVIYLLVQYITFSIDCSTAQISFTPFFFVNSNYQMLIWWQFCQILLDHQTINDYLKMIYSGNK